jgi:RNA polymerase sigma factor (sigma-70 family)
MYHRNQKPLRLDARQQALFDSGIHLTRIAAARYRKFCPPSAIDDLRQAALVALAKAARNFRLDDNGPFGALAWLRVRDACRDFCIGDRRLGNAATRHAEYRELPADEVLGFSESEPITRGEAVARLHGRMELQSDRASDNLAGRLFDARMALQTATMTAFERRVLKLRFEEGLELDPIAAKLGVPTIRIKRTLRTGIAKLRVHLSSAGLKTLAPEAPIPWSQPEIPARSRSKAA